MNIIDSEYIIDTLFNIRDYPKDYSNEELFNYVDDLIDTIKNNKNIVNQLQIELKDRKLNMGYCPDCNAKLETKTTSEPHYELSEFGYTPCENFYVKVCPDCGEEYD